MNFINPIIEEDKNYNYTKENNYDSAENNDNNSENSFTTIPAANIEDSDGHGNNNVKVDCQEKEDSSCMIMLKPLNTNNGVKKNNVHRKILFFYLFCFKKVFRIFIFFKFFNI